MPASVLRLRIPAVAFAITFAAMCLVMLLVGSLAHAGVDPADAAGAASAAGAAAVASLAQPAPVDLSQSVHQMGWLTAIAASLGLFLRAVAIPVFKSVILGAFFSKVPLPIQHLIVAILSAASGGLVAYGMGQGFFAALSAAFTAFGTSQFSYGLTAPLFEKRDVG